MKNKIKKFIENYFAVNEIQQGSPEEITISLFASSLLIHLEEYDLLAASGVVANAKNVQSYVDLGMNEKGEL